MASQYEDSQSLYNGQKQQPKELQTLFSNKPYPGMTIGQSIYCRKFKKHCHDLSLTSDIAAKLMDITPGHVIDLWKGFKPFTQDLEVKFYLAFDKKISTVRLDEASNHQRNARMTKYKEIWLAYYDEVLKYEPKFKKTLFPCSYEWKRSTNIKKFSHPMLGDCFKCWRAAMDETQYSIPDKIKIYFNQDGKYCERPCWRDIEKNNSVTQEANIAFFETYGLTIQQAIMPFVAYAKQNKINLKNKKQAKVFFTNLEQQAKDLTNTENLVTI